ncbi:MAG: DUF2953 domain-containing protein [Clostridiales bacterium]|nr:DUF2953 domain-containing protein [Clostridiales bacterium]
MIYILILLAILILITVLLYFSSVRVELASNKVKNKLSFHTRTSIGYGSLRINASKKDKPVNFSNIKFIPKDIDLSYEFDVSNLKSLFSGGSNSTDKIKQYYNLNRKGISYLAAKTKIYDVFLDLKFGLDNASYTAVIYGAISILITNIIAFLKKTMMINIKRIDVKPVFNEIVFEYDFGCIIEARLGDIIIALIAVKKKKRGVVFGTTYSSVNENNS